MASDTSCRRTEIEHDPTSADDPMERTMTHISRTSVQPKNPATSRQNLRRSDLARRRLTLACAAVSAGSAILTATRPVRATTYNWANGVTGNWTDVASWSPTAPTG